MSIFFQVCFGVGLGYAVLSFLIGQLLGGLTGGSADADAGFDADADIDLDFDIDIDADIDTGGDFNIDIPDGAGAEPSGTHASVAVSPFKPTVIAAFLVVFGGAGMIVLTSLGVYLSLTVAGAAGLIAGGAVYRLYAFLYSRQNTSAVAKHSLIGYDAKVSEFIPQGKYGKITYYVNGNTYTAPAKSDNGEEIRRGSNVEIVSIVKSTYYVKQKLLETDAVASGSPAEAPAPNRPV